MGDKSKNFAGMYVDYRSQMMRLIDSGVLDYYDYGHLYNTSKKIIARTTTQDRMLKSAEYFMAGFFGLDWAKNVTLEVIIEEKGFNNSLIGYDNCNNSNLAVAQGGTNASTIWQNSYLQNAEKRFQKLSGEFQWNSFDVYKCVFQWLILSLAAADALSEVLRRCVPLKQLHLVTPLSVTCLPMRNGKGLNMH